MQLVFSSSNNNNTDMPHKFILDSEGTAGSCSALGSLVENPNSVQF